MNKLELIQSLKAPNGLSKPEAEKVVNLFFNEMATALENGKGLKSVDSAPFSLRNTNLTLVAIPKPARR